MLLAITDALHKDSPAVSPVSLTAATAGTLLAADPETNNAQAGGAAWSNTQTWSGIVLSADAANTTPVYVLLGTGVPSATNWHFVLPAGTTLDVNIGGVAWRGAIQGFSTAAAKVGVVLA